MVEQVKPDEAELERLKLEKNNRIRKNLRILALCAAAYYFISAGFSFYEESQDKKIRIDSEIRTVFETDTAGAFQLAHKYDDTKVNLTFQEISQNHNQTLYAIICDHDNQGKFLIEELDGKISALEIYFKGESFKDAGLEQALRYAIAISENNTQSTILDEVFKAMQYDPNSENPSFQNADLSSKKVRYQVQLGKGSEVTITFKALPQV